MASNEHTSRDRKVGLSRRQFLARSMMAAGGLVLAACTTNPGSNPAGNTGGTGGGTSTTGGASSPVAQTTSGTGKPPAKGGKITLTQWYHHYGEKGTQEAVNRYAKEYTKQNPNVEINVVWAASTADYDTKLSAALLTPQGPDVYEGHFNIQIAQRNQAAPLDDLYTADVKKDFNQSALDLNTYNGHIYAVEIILDPQLLFYRKSMLDKAGVDPSSIQSADDMMNAVKKLTQGRVKGIYVGKDGGSVLGGVLPYSNNGALVKDGKIVWDSQETVQAMGFLKNLAASNYELVGYTTDWINPAALIQGAAAIQWSGMWITPQVKDALKDDFGVMPWPKYDQSGQPISVMGGWAEMVNPKSKHVDEAKKFVKWLWIENKKIQEDFATSYGFHIPPRKSVASSAKALKSGAAKDIVDIANKYGISAPIQWSNEINTDWTDALTKIIKNHADVKPTLEAAAKKAQPALNQLLKNK